MMFSVACESYGVFCHKGKRYQAGVGRAYVCFVPWSKCCSLIENVVSFATWEKCYHRAMPKIFSLSYKKRYLGHLTEMWRRVTKEILLGLHCRNALPMLRDKCSFDDIARSFPSCSERNMSFLTWQRCYKTVLKVKVYSTRDRYIADM